MRETVALVALLVVPGGAAAQYGPRQVPQPYGFGAPAAAQRDVIAREETSGTVRDVDRTSGAVVVDAPGGPLRLRFPAATVERIRRGDRVTVALALSGRGADSTSSEGAGMNGTDPEQGSPDARPPGSRPAAPPP